MKVSNPVVINAMLAKNAEGHVVCNNVGDCFADATFMLEKAWRLVGNSPGKAKGLVSQAKHEATDATSYDYEDKQTNAAISRDSKKCVSAIAAAESNPTQDTIMAARWECEKARARWDGGSPNRKFWSTTTNAEETVNNNGEAPVAKNAYNVGDTVTLKKPLTDYNRTIPGGAKAKIVATYGNGWYDIEVDGKLYGHSLADTNFATNCGLGPIANDGEAPVAENADDDTEWREFDAIVNAMKNKWRPVSAELHKLNDMLFKRKVGYKTATEIRDYIEYLDTAILKY